MTGGVVAVPARNAATPARQPDGSLGGGPARIGYAEGVAGGEESLFERKGEPAIRDQIVLGHIGLARYTARRFLGTGEPLEDLVQEAITGLIGAVDRFDPKLGVEFSTYAIATMVGTIQHYLRDKCWTLKVLRPLQELGLKIAKAEKALSQKLGRSPAIPEIADHLEIDEEQVIEGIAVRSAFRVGFLDQPVFQDDKTICLKDFISSPDRESREWADQADLIVSLREAIGSLCRRQREVIFYRFWLEISQTETAKRLGCSQVEVSRIERKAKNELQAALAMMV